MYSRPRSATLMECPTCKHPFDLGQFEPKVLTCGHSICLTCVDEQFDTRITDSTDYLPNDQFDCLLCNRVTTIPRAGIHKIPSNQQLIDYLKVELENGDEYIEAAFCTTCGKDYPMEDMMVCTDCIKHKVEFTIMSEIDVGESLESEVICSKCAIRYHLQQKHEVVEYTALKAETETVSQLNEIDENLKHLVDSMNHLHLVSSDVKSITERKMKEFNLTMLLLNELPNDRKKQRASFLDELNEEMDKILSILDPLHDPLHDLNIRLVSKRFNDAYCKLQPELIEEPTVWEGLNRQEESFEEKDTVAQSFQVFNQ